MRKIGYIVESDDRRCRVEVAWLVDGSGYLIRESRGTVLEQDETFGARVHRGQGDAAFAEACQLADGAVGAYERGALPVHPFTVMAVRRAYEDGDPWHLLVTPVRAPFHRQAARCGLVTRPEEGWEFADGRATLKAVADVPLCPVCWDTDPDGRPGTSVGDLLLAAGRSMAGADRLAGGEEVVL